MNAVVTFAKVVFAFRAAVTRDAIVTPAAAVTDVAVTPVIVIAKGCLMTYDVMGVDMNLWLDNFNGNIAEAIQPMVVSQDDGGSVQVETQDQPSQLSRSVWR